MRSTPYNDHAYTIALGSETDYDWYYEATGLLPPNKGNSFISWHDQSFMKERVTGTIAILSSDLKDWIFTTSSFMLNDTELVGNTNKVEVSMAINGLGLPDNEYLVVARKLYGMSPKIQCHS
jgi:hypothetical protein